MPTNAQFSKDAVKQALNDYDPSFGEVQKEAVAWINLNSADCVARQLKAPEGQE